MKQHSRAALGIQLSDDSPLPIVAMSEYDSSSYIYIRNQFIEHIQYGQSKIFIEKRERGRERSAFIGVLIHF